MTKSATEFTPLLSGTLGENEDVRLSFRRRVSSTRKSITKTSTDATDPISHTIRPVDGLSPLAPGGVITTMDGYQTMARPPSVVKSLPAFAPYRRKARHRSFYLWWINEFRHWWKSSRLLVRLAGLFTLAFTGIFLQRMLNVTVDFPEPLAEAATSKALKHWHKDIAKNTRHAVKIVKRLGQGGPMKFFLKYVKPFTRTLRLFVAGWRWVEAAQCRRGEVGTEEAFAFMGNRVSRMLARLAVDSLVAYLVMPLAYELFEWLEQDTWWHPITLFIVLGCLRAVAPYAASFQGSRAGRVLTRQFFINAKHRWLPLQSVQTLNLSSDDCCEMDEISQTAFLAVQAKQVAKAFGKAKEIGLDGMEGQREILKGEGFHQVGAGSGGYAVYVCHHKAEGMTILLHVTPYGPSILNVLPRYIVLECEDSVDRRNNWSEYISKRQFEGPPVVEGYCYGGAFFSPHHFAELKERYDKQLLTYQVGCKTLCKPRTGRNPNPPSDLKSLKTFLADAKKPKKRRRNKRQYDELQRGVHRVAKELKRMMASSAGDQAPKGVILYFEGLDCAGKSSTGGLVEQALAEAGFQVNTKQYNRPPTAEQKLRPWMDRFDVPGANTTVALAVPNGSDDDNGDVQSLLEKHSALVWDRGPAGDFVYNPEYRAMLMDERRKRYQEFMEFDRECFTKRILFLKLLFVTNRDSIASTLGKRLAQKQMAYDLRTWHKASRGGESDSNVGFEGLDAIENHLDPTDFVAFNSYQTNLRIFTNFALNTNTPENPWIVVNTGDRYAARKALLREFQTTLHRFKSDDSTCCKPTTPAPSEVPEAVSEEEMMEKGPKRAPPTGLLVSLMGLLIILFYYSSNTTFRSPSDIFRDTFINIEDLLPAEDEEDGSSG